jgi:hypothetical protein
MEKAKAGILEEEADWKGKTKPQPYTGYDENDIVVRASRIRLPRDGESDTNSSDTSATESEPVNPENVIELTYLRDPSVFDRDANTSGRARTRS